MAPGSRRVGSVKYTRLERKTRGLKGRVEKSRERGRESEKGPKRGRGIYIISLVHFTPLYSYAIAVET